MSRLLLGQIHGPDFHTRNLARHGLSEENFSDRGSQFISKLWTRFLKGLENKPCLPSGYHSHLDGQTKIVNIIHEHFSALLCPKKARQHGGLAVGRTFSDKNNVQSSTSMSPFQENFGLHPRVIIGGPTVIFQQQMKLYPL